jgi:hypothetical protein
VAQRHRQLEHMADEACEGKEEPETLQAIYSNLVIRSDGSAYIGLPVALDNPLPIISGNNVTSGVQHTVSHSSPLLLTFTFDAYISLQLLL